MKQGSTLFLKGVVILIGLMALAFCVLAVPAGLSSNAIRYYYPIVAGMGIPAAIPFFIALFQTLKLLGYIDADKAFSALSVRALKKIKYCAVVISGLFTAGMPYVVYAADQDNALGVVVLGFIIIGASVVIAVFAAVLQKLLQSAIDIKSENDLTV